MKKQREYLDTKFEELRSVIEQQEKNGWVYSACPSCGHNAFRYAFTSIPTGIEVGRCEVCEDGTHIRCPKCRAEMNLANYRLRKHKCQKCSKEFSKEDIAQLLGDTYGGFFDFHHGDVGSNTIFCNDCETCSVANIAGTWFCTSCAREFADDEIVSCEYCNEQIAGGSDDTYFYGCCMCEGKYGDIMTEDD